MFKEGLTDLGFIGSKYTWIRGNKDATFTGARLDRALCNTEWLSCFPQTSVTHLARIASDYAPILVNTNERAPRTHATFFKFQAAWARHPDFNNCMQDMWSSDNSFLESIAKTKVNLKTWNMQVFDNIERRKKRLIARIGRIQKRLDEAPNTGLIKLVKKLCSNMEETLYQEELGWFQKSREEWIHSGDRNTRFYHAAMMVRRAKQKIHKLKDEN